MNIVVFGVGGVGGFFGGKLAKAGHEVTFIARGKHLEAIKENGLTVKSIEGDFKIPKAKATDEVAIVKHADVIFLAVKSWQVEDIGKQLKSVLKPDAVVIPLQNGADNAEKLLISLRKNQVLGGLCRIISKIESPGVINHFAFHPQIIFGELNNEKSDRVLKIQWLFMDAKVDCIVPEDIQAAIWTKFLFITTISGLGALTRSEIGVMREDEKLRDMMQQTANEILEIANTKGININQKTIEKAFAAIDKQAYHTTASMQRDIMEGRPSELENFNGYVVKEGLKMGIPTPVNSFIYNCLLPMEKKARKHLRN
ncbi:ketopantoate reductase family protein [Spongiivirga citrea]|uniref:2-dehydropantoate 2-reductase n=1 Tax=Spongiivirga citrea TaxID=1481457 RepID=A0A6M0CT18_9FLAO|nr:2-dehydropantoate 2-reductase [Spongiivirga citrea]NER16970.1 2-dehydropantoate 2-reductase [Spongiivirga citrea]